MLRRIKYNSHTSIIMYKPSGLLWEDDIQYIGHLDVLSKLKEENFHPNVIYDIGSCEGNWTEMATTLWHECDSIYSMLMKI